MYKTSGYNGMQNNGNKSMATSGYDSATNGTLDGMAIACSHMRNSTLVDEIRKPGNSVLN